MPQAGPPGSAPSTPPPRVDRPRRRPTRSGRETAHRNGGGRTTRASALCCLYFRLDLPHAPPPAQTGHEGASLLGRKENVIYVRSWVAPRQGARLDERRILPIAYSSLACWRNVGAGAFRKGFLVTYRRPPPVVNDFYALSGQVRFLLSRRTVMGQRHSLSAVRTAASTAHLILRRGGAHGAGPAAMPVVIEPGTRTDRVRTPYSSHTERWDAVSRENAAVSPSWHLVSGRGGRPAAPQRLHTGRQ